MQAGALRALEFEQIVEVVRGLTLTPPGSDRAGRSGPGNGSRAGRGPLAATSEASAFSRATRRFRCARRRTSAPTSTLWRCRAARSSQQDCWRSQTISIQSNRRAPRFVSVASSSCICGARGAGRVLPQRNRRRPPQDCPIGRSGRSRQPASCSDSRPAAQAAHRACAACWSRTCAAKKPRSTCRNRSSPTATAATCSCVKRRAPIVDSGDHPRQLGERRQPVPRAARARSRSTTTSSRSRSRKRRRSAASCCAHRRVSRAGADLQRTLDAATELDVLQAKAPLRGAGWTGSNPSFPPMARFELRGARHPLLIPQVASPT